MSGALLNIKKCFRYNAQLFLPISKTMKIKDLKIILAITLIGSILHLIITIHLFNLIVDNQIKIQQLQNLTK